MNWDALGGVGEIIGALAVVGTLGYLAVQIRGQTRQANASMQKEVGEQFNALHISIMTNKQLGEVLAKVANGTKLTDGETYQWISTVNSTLNAYALVQTSYEKGLMDRENYDNYLSDVGRAAALYNWADPMKEILAEMPNLRNMEIFTPLYESDKNAV